MLAQTVLWRQFASEGEDGDDEAALSSEHCLQCISSLLPLSDGDAAMFRELQAALMPVLSVAFDTTAKRVEQLDGAIDLFYLMACVACPRWAPSVGVAARA